MTGCTVQAIRHYEKQQLLGANRRSEGNFRLFDPSAVDRLLFIKYCRSLDLTVSEIRQLLELNRFPGTHCDHANQLIDRHIRQIECRIGELNELLRQLKSIRSRCSSDRTVAHCGILQQLSEGSNATED